MRAEELADYDGLALGELVRSREISPKELIDTASETAMRIDSKLNFLVAPTPEQARKDLAQLDPNAPFCAVPTLVKDIGPRVAGVPQELGSLLARGLVPSEDSEFIRRVRRAGLVCIGRSTTPELGSAFTTEPRIASPTRNPWDPRRSPGGSSGGAAVAVASGVVPVALAGDTAGSIRIPAHCCGVFGFKPSRGRNPTGPESGETNSGLTVAHVITRSVRDSAAMLDATAGPDPGCRYGAPGPSSGFLASLSEPPRRLRIAYWTKNAFGGSVEAAIVSATLAAAKLCEALGHPVTEIDPPLGGDEIIATVEPLLAANLYHFVRHLEQKSGRTASPELLEASTLALARRGAEVSANELLTCLARMNELSRRIGRLSDRYDVFLTPTFTAVAPELGRIRSDVAGCTSLGYLTESLQIGAFTIQYNLTGQPAMSVPLSQSEQGLPIGVQFAAHYGADEALFRLAGQLEAASPWRMRRPPAARLAQPANRHPLSSEHSS
ncbi:MAG: amidase [Proteobacteria bacterium]|nr:amidase [Pseudomonadota bacterium]